MHSGGQKLQDDSPYQSDIIGSSSGAVIPAVENRRLKGPNLLIPSKKFDAQGEHNDLKVRRVNQIVTEVKESYQNGTDLPEEANVVIQNTL